MEVTNWEEKWRYYIPVYITNLPYPIIDVTQIIKDKQLKLIDGFEYNPEAFYWVIDTYGSDDYEKAFNYFYVGDTERAIRCLQSANYETLNKFIVLQNIETEERIFIPYQNRFNKDYIKKVRKKLANIDFGKCKSIGHFVLTLENLTIIELIEKKRNISKAFAYFRKKVGEILGIKIDYICVKEVTKVEKNLYHLHMHMICKNLGYLNDKTLNRIKKAWKTAGKQVGLKTEYIHYGYCKTRDVQKVYNYAIKYISKSFGEVNTSSGILFFMGVKSFSTSLKRFISVPKNLVKKYVFLGVFEYNYCVTAFPEFIEIYELFSKGG